MKKRLMTVLAVILTFTLLASTVSFAAGGDKFSDVDGGAWYKQYVDFVVDNGYMNGTSATKFEPNSDMTRAMFVTVLARLEGVSVDNNASTSFSDVPSGTWYTGSVAWANSLNIVNGVGGGNFNPNASVTRQDMCVIMERYIDWVEATKNKTHKTPNPKVDFSDESQISSYAKAAVDESIMHGLIYGYPDGTFKPLKNSTRAEVAAVIYRLAWLTKGNPSSGSSGSSKTTYYEVKANIDTPAGSVELLKDYTTAQAKNTTVDSVAKDLIGGDNKDLLINAADAALEKIKDQSYSGGEYTVSISEDGVITSTRNGIDVDLQEQLDQEKATYETTMGEIYNAALAGGEIDKAAWDQLVADCWVENLFDFSTATAPKLLSADDYYGVLEKTVNEACDLYTTLRDGGYDFAKGVEAVAQWGDEKGLKYNSYAINEGSVVNPTDVLTGTGIIGMLNYTENLVIDEYDRGGKVFSATETIEKDADAILQLIEERTSMDLTDHEGGFEAILEALVSNGKLTGDYTITITVDKVTK